MTTAPAYASAPSTMPATTIATGIVSIVLGVGLAVGAHLNGSKWETATIPAGIGAIFVVLGVLAKKPHLRKHVIHGAAVFALLLALGCLGMGVPKIIRHASGNWPADLPAHPLAWWGQVAFAVVMCAYLALAVRSFIAAKRWRQANG